MQSMAPRPCFFIISRARSVRYLRSRSQLTRCCQSRPAMPKFAPIYAVPLVGRAHARRMRTETLAGPLLTGQRRASISRRFLAGIGGKAGGLDACNRAFLVVIRNVARN